MIYVKYTAQAAQQACSTSKRIQLPNQKFNGHHVGNICKFCKILSLALTFLRNGVVSQLERGTNVAYDKLTGISHSYFTINSLYERDLGLNQQLVPMMYSITHKNNGQLTTSRPLCHEVNFSYKLESVQSGK